MTFICEKCMKEFTCARDLERHLERKTPCDKGEVECPGCGGNFSCRKAVNLHLRKNRCKGKPTVVENRELAQELEVMKQRLEQQDQLLQMTNQVTAAASSSTNHTHINTQNNYVTVNIDSLQVTAGIGQENLKHLSKLSSAEVRNTLHIAHTPQALADWCALVRADESHPENHNALLLERNQSQMACNRDGKWTMDDTDKVLLELSRCDMMRFYNQLGRYESDAVLQSFRNEYLLHNLMTKSNSGDTLGLKPLMDAISKPLIELTQKLYAVPEASTMTDEQRHIETGLKRLQTIAEKRQAAFQQEHAELLSEIMAMRRQLVASEHVSCNIAIPQ